MIIVVGLYYDIEILLDMAVIGDFNVNVGFINMNMGPGNGIKISEGFWKFLEDSNGPFKTFDKGLSKGRDDNFVRDTTNLGKGSLQAVEVFLETFSNA